MSSNHVKRAAQRAFRAAVLTRDGYRCQQCGTLGGRLEAHHIIALEHGGEHHPDNGLTLCRDCHIDAHRPDVPAERAAWAALVAELLP